MTWIKGSAINKDAAKDEEVSEQIVKMLKARSAHNKVLRFSVKAGAIPLTRLEERLVKQSHASVSKEGVPPALACALPRASGQG